jgi:ATP-binding cassette, subfamily C, bacterial CydD
LSRAPDAHRELLRQARSARLFIAATVALGVLAATATVFQMGSLGRIVDQVFLKEADLADVRDLMVLLLGAVLARAALLLAQEVVAERGAVRVKSELREQLFARILCLGPAYVGGERAGELTAATTEGIERLGPYFSRYLPQLALSAAVPLLVLVYVFPKDFSSAVLLLVSAPVIPFMMVLVGSYAEEHTKRQWESLSRMSAHFLDAVQGLPTLKAFGQEDAERERGAAVNEEFRERTLKVLSFAFLSGLVLEFMSAAAIALVAVTLGVRLVSGHLPFEEALVVLLLAPEFYKPLRELGASRHAGMEGRAAAERIFEILETPAALAGESSGPTNKLPGLLTVKLLGIGFTYPGNEHFALTGIDLLLESGGRTAVVGPSGAGKSTLVNLLMRFLEAREGTIEANGVPIRDLQAGAWREHVALVPQRPHLFYGSVLENIRLSRPGARRAEVERAAELAAATEFIRRLPDGYDTHIGEQGARLSAGEAQRVAIARAFLKDAPLLILDEPTSSLDPESERLIRQAVDRLAEGRTALIVAHRLNTARGADRIVVMEDGRVVGAGVHEDLLRCCSLYARLLGTRGRVLA